MKNPNRPRVLFCQTPSPRAQKYEKPEPGTAENATEPRNDLKLRIQSTRNSQLTGNLRDRVAQRAADPVAVQVRQKSIGAEAWLLLKEFMRRRREFASIIVMKEKPRSTQAVEMGVVSHSSMSSERSRQNGRMRI